MPSLCERRGLPLKLVPIELCTDNAAMIGSAARFADPDPLPRVPRLRRLPHAQAGSGMSSVTVYSRPGCHLCEEAIEALVALHGEGYRFQLHEVDIESEELLLRRLLEKIPVVEIDGVVVSELILDEAAVRARLDTVGA